MKTEPILFFDGNWYHIYLDAVQGLCISKKTDFKFSRFARLMPNAYDDFSAVATETKLHIVCQDHEGAIIYFTYDGQQWNTQRILESKRKTPERKNITLKLIGNFVNLFYAIHTKDAYLLVHQLLGETIGQPKIVDEMIGTEFSVCNHQTSDLTVFYQNSDNLCGTRKFRWSKKDFEEFCPLECSCVLEHAVILADKHDNLQIAAYATFEKFVNILFLTKHAQTGEMNIAAIHLVSGIADGLALSEIDGMPTISWCENGLVMSTTLSEDDRWPAPKKLIRSATQETVCYQIQAKKEHLISYGFMQENRQLFYLHRTKVEQLLQEHKKAPARAQSALSAADYVTHSVYTADMAKVHALLEKQNEIIRKILKKITVPERTVCHTDEIVEDTQALDQLAFRALQEDKHYK